MQDNDLFWAGSSGETITRKDLLTIINDLEYDGWSVVHLGMAWDKDESYELFFNDGTDLRPIDKKRSYEKIV